MSQLGNSGTKRKRTYHIDESDDDEITVICEKQVSRSSTSWDNGGSQTFAPYYTRTTIPTYSGRREKRELKKKSKTVAVRAICKDLGIDIVEWECDSEYEVVQFGADTVVKEVNEMTSF
uniref:Uncharacterized protein n=1 Tax=Heterorhabditis bacteriophora TaxID=37862 RepID=A0A1I7WYB5_HETBA